jgi:hypothetical protein
MTPELKAAAEYILHPNVFRTTFNSSAVLLAKHYLSQLDSDGDEAVDKEWLRSVGFSWTSDCYHDSSDEWEASMDLGSNEVIRIRKSETILDMGKTYWCNVRHCTTRGQVRQLLSALGISTNESE